MQRCIASYRQSANGQKLAYTCVPVEDILKDMEILTKEHYPLEGYDAFADSTLVESFEGTVAEVKGFVAYTGPSTKQDLRCFKHRPRKREGGEVKFEVHTGFWKELVVCASYTVITGLCTPSLIR